jgi:hypothetical protein
MILHFEGNTLGCIIDELFILLAKLDRIRDQWLQASDSEAAFLIRDSSFNLAINRLSSRNGRDLDIL